MEILSPAKIKVMGIGGGGCNAVNRMYKEGVVENVELYAVNTDAQALEKLEVPNKIQIGEKVTRGRGAGAKPELGEQAAQEDIDKIKAVLSDADMVFLSVGLGGGTGTGAAPVIAKTAKELGILTVAVATLPFKFEGRRRMKVALEGLEKLKENVDTYIIIHNDRIKELSGKALTIKGAFSEVDAVLSRSVRGVTNIINSPLDINADFSDVRTVMEEGGLALIGMGEATGEGKMEKAIENAMTNPLLEGGTIEGAKRLLITVWVSEDVAFDEIYDAITLISEKAHEEPLIVFGAALEEDKEDYMRIAVIATDFDLQIAKDQKESMFKVIKKEPPQIQRSAEETSISPVEPEEELPAYLRRKRKI